MRAITKRREPPSLTAYRQTPGCDYENYADKAALRHALVTEQRGLCCYCMGRIHNGPLTMKIEHWQSQTRYPAVQLNYRNLLGACLGGEGQPPELQHCDTRKGHRDLTWNPADPAHHHHIQSRLRYEIDGSIRSDETQVDRELNEVLNLNLPFLRNNRKSVLDAILAWWRQERRSAPVPRVRFERERDRRIAGDGELEPFCQVAVWWLEQRLNGMAI